MSDPSKPDENHVRLLCGEYTVILQGGIKNTQKMDDRFFSGLSHIAFETFDVARSLYSYREQGVNIKENVGSPQFNPKVWGTGMSYFNILSDFSVAFEVCQRLDKMPTDSVRGSVGLEHIGIRVSDIARSIKFYSFLGFKNLTSVEIPGVSKIFCTMMGLGTISLELYQFTEHSCRPCLEPRPIDSLVMSVEDVSKAYEVFDKAGLSVSPLECDRFGLGNFFIWGPDQEKIWFTETSKGGTDSAI